MEVKKGYKQTEIGVIPIDWEVKRLGELGNFSKGQGIRKDEAQSGDIPCIRYGEIYTKHDNVIKEFYSFISPSVAKTAKKIKQGDILFAGSGETKEEIGKCVANIISEEAYAGGDIVILSPLNADSLLLGYLLNSPPIAKQKSSKGQGDAVVHISAKGLKDVVIPLSKAKSEQSAIAAVISETDNLITNLEKLITKKEAVKKGTMQALLTGKKRLPGFNSKWPKKKIKNLFKFLSTANNSRSELSNEGEIGYIHYGDIHTKWSEFLDVSTESIPFIKKDKIKDVPFLENGDLLIADASEDYEGLCACIELKNVNHLEIVGGLHTLLLRGNKDEIADGFKGYLLHLKGFKEAVIKAATGISVYGISKKNLGEIEIIIPDANEQSSIAAVIADMTTEIKQLEEKLQKYKVIKQGMMQNLLTGKIRII